MTDHTPIVWTRQTTHLWTGRRSGYPIGTIEHGHRFTFTGINECSTRHRTLRDAQAAAEAA